MLDSVTVRYTGRPAFVSEISGGMQSDMTRSVVGTGLIVAVLFWWTHRRFKPMGWLMLLMATAIGLTLAFGGLIYGPLNVISVGFAAILLGLAADYGMVLYQEWREHAVPGQQTGVGSARRGVRWSALTTASAFLMLNLSGLPGLSQLGTLVAIGVLVGAALMLRLYLRPFLNEPAPSPGAVSESASRVSRVLDRMQSKAAVTVTLALLAGLVAALWTGFPALNRSADSLRPRTSPAYTALHEIEERMQSSGLSLWLILSGRNEADAGHTLDQAAAALTVAQAAGSVDRFKLPTDIWPRPANVAANRSAVVQLIAAWPDLRARVLAGGFTTNALALAEGVMDAFSQSLTTTNAWPDNAVARWSLGQFAARTPTNLFVMGLVYPSRAADAPAAVLPRELDGRAWLVGWERLGHALADLVRRDLGRVLIPTLRDRGRVPGSGVQTGARSGAEPWGAGAFAGGAVRTDEAGRMVMESPQSHGPAAATGRGRGLQHSHAAGAPPLQWGPGQNTALGGTRTVSLRRNDRHRLWITQPFEQCRPRQPGPGLRHRGGAHLSGGDVSFAGLVAGQLTKLANRRTALEVQRQALPRRGSPRHSTGRAAGGPGCGWDGCLPYPLFVGLATVGAATVSAGCAASLRHCHSEPASRLRQ